ncbi:MAG: sigma-70 family RNA polymerase sigma factor [Clostridia bacterium]|nr:sigma-70 family RNA polymerase sigma factor [Clostridia bacterium]
MLDYSLLNDEELVALCKNNDDKAFSVLTERYIPLSKILASRFCSSSIEKDDLAQEGMLGFIAAVYAYNKNSGASFSTFSGYCMKNRIISAIRTISSKKRIPLELTVPLEDRQDFLSNDLTPEESLISREESERIAAMIESELSDKERTVFLLFLQGMRYEQIAAECSCTQKSVDGTLQRVRKKLREKLS